MIEEVSKGIRLHLYVQPNGQKSEVLGEHDGALKIRIQAAPIEGKANKAVEKFVAQLFEVPVSRVTIIRGEQSRSKVVEITGLSPAEATSTLAKFRKTN